jgi:hypothetical protein
MTYKAITCAIGFATIPKIRKERLCFSADVILPRSVNRRPPGFVKGVFDKLPEQQEELHGPPQDR